ncbi:hypothetical protein [Rubrimonas cliftonensis]|uniref:Uncharacterized protein n=1 Tax=Rubrimonas cliftonensis TaxID=89524 RepID=A0A1H4FZL3_9RHOB|nr:hypothetical protein [Rubrimonas cliftonensis]SEB02108.1 hypothetical protein SAMN05444370_1316 [Rubrimonas cliftonensis]
MSGASTVEAGVGLGDQGPGVEAALQSLRVVFAQSAHERARAALVRDTGPWRLLAPHARRRRFAAFERCASARLERSSRYPFTRVDLRLAIAGDEDQTITVDRQGLDLEAVGDADRLRVHIEGRPDPAADVPLRVAL